MDDSDFTFDYDQASFIGTWTFNTSLADGKYAIHLDDSINDGSNLLDAEWMNDAAGTPDIYSDDPIKDFATDLGNGTPGTMGSEFRFHFALLAGDYDGDGQVEVAEISAGDGNGDGVVDALDDAVGTIGDMLPLRALGDADFDDDEIVNGIDLAIWETNYGTRLATHADGDADGDQDVDGDDLAIWNDQYGMSGANLAADFDGDGFVSGSDFLIWQLGQGLGVGLGGDANGDAMVSGIDFLIWQTKVTLTSAWYVDWDNAVATVAAGLALPTGEGAAPQVLNLVISGSGSLHNPFSFDTVDGSGSQLATVPVGAADTISIAFSENVNIAANSLKVIGLTRGNLPTLADFSYDTATNTATWRFENWTLFGDNYLISLTDGITDVDGNWLDGEWINPESITTINSLVSEFPSGDGTLGGNFNFVMTLLPGDADLDGDVDISDIAIFEANFAQSPTGQLFTDADFNGDGDVSLSDLSFFFWGVNLQNTWILADLDGDYDVDDVDLQTITDNYGMTGATLADGDLSGDGVVGIEDMELAFAQFGLEIGVVS